MRVRDEKNTETLKQELLARLASCEKRQQEAAEKARTIVVEDEVKIVQPHPEKEPVLEKIRLYEEKKEEQRRKEEERQIQQLVAEKEKLLRLRNAVPTTIDLRAEKQQLLEKIRLYEQQKAEQAK